LRRSLRRFHRDSTTTRSRNSNNDCWTTVARRSRSRRPRTNRLPTSGAAAVRPTS
jgi:hypothetical protein